MNSIFEKFTIERNLIYILIGAVLIVFFIIIYLFVAYGTKSIRVVAPSGEEEWEIGQTYEITWQARKIDKVGIVLFNGTKPEWIAENVDAKLGRYEWKIYPGHDYGYGFWVAVFEYPWQKGNKIDYSDNAFAITYPILASCDVLSILNEWPYVASDLPELRRAFITEESFTGNLDGLEGADKKCQQQAEKQGFEGNWLAFLGGDSDEEITVKRLENTVRGINGIFIQAEPSAVLIRGATCHRLLAKNLDEFLTRFSELAIINAEKLDKDFFENMSNVWLGRLDEKSKKNCISVAKEYSFTTTCQNWTNSKKRVEVGPPFPTCYTSSGQLVDATALASLASSLIGKDQDAVFTPAQGKYCNDSQKLLCIEQ